MPELPFTNSLTISSSSICIWPRGAIWRCMRKCLLYSCVWTEVYGNAVQSAECNVHRKSRAQGRDGGGEWARGRKGRSQKSEVRRIDEKINDVLHRSHLKSFAGGIFPASPFGFDEDFHQNQKQATTGAGKDLNPVTEPESRKP